VVFCSRLRLSSQGAHFNARWALATSGNKYLGQRMLHASLPKPSKLEQEGDLDKSLSCSSETPLVILLEVLCMTRAARHARSVHVPTDFDRFDFASCQKGKAFGKLGASAKNPPA
jgi:hypothetical protein